MSERERAVRWLMWSWWILFPCFAVLTARLTVERTCADPYNLLPALTSQPHWAWPLALVYLLGHLWAIAVWLLVVARSQELAPRRSAYRMMLGGHTVQFVMMAAVLVLEYSPISVWRLVGVRLGCAN